MGGRDQEMTFGIGRIAYTDMYKTDANARTIVGAVGDPASPTVDGPNRGAVFNLAHLPSDAVVAKEYGRAGNRGSLEGTTLAANTTYVTKVVTDAEKSWADANNKQAEVIGKALVSINGTAVSRTGGGGTDYNQLGDLTIGDVLVNGAAGVAAGDHDFATVNSGDNAFLAGHEYEIVSLGNSNGNTQTAGSDAASIMGAVTAITGGTLAAGTKFTIKADATATEMARMNSMIEGMTFRMSTDTLTKDIEAMQGLVNTARVQAGSQYAAIESAVNYTTDLTAQYELGYNTVNDVNFSMETAHLAKNQILQQAATAMLAQANQGQQGLLQLIS
jgi:flagellin-like hook-associated protein FlgL